MATEGSQAYGERDAHQIHSAGRQDRRENRWDGSKGRKRRTIQCFEYRCQQEHPNQNMRGAARRAECLLNQILGEHHTEGLAQRRRTTYGEQ